MIKRAAVLNDISGLGRCSLTMALPLLSALGVQCCPVPTAVLSSQTDGYTGYSLAETELEPYLAHWRRLGERFDGIYSGYLGSRRQTAIVEALFENHRSPGCLVMIDPVMGDDGALYPSLDPGLCESIRELILKADLITPNLTEAAILLGRDYAKNPDPGELARALHALGPDVVITGADAGDGRICTVSCDKSGAVYHYNKKADASYPGSGDMFASVLLGARLRGFTLCESTAFAAAFTGDCVSYTLAQGTPRREGLVFEPLLAKLTGFTASFEGQGLRADV